MKKTIFILILLLISCDKSNSVQQNRQQITSSKAPKAIGPYSQAIKVGNKVYLAGQIGLDPDGSGLKEGIEAQTHQTLKNISEILKEAGFSLNDVVQCQIYLQNLEHYKTVNNIYATYFNESKPARAVVEVSKIPAEALIEIMVTAEK